ncbi:hypothetical protein ACH4OY_12395 [Micromonospora rubida]|uniref:Uncharacterized protein n=1 Tax=Micromonospora rubida TaxID=2697657 RepID=A0ABW7SMM8_9ACTN
MTGVELIAAALAAGAGAGTSAAAVDVYAGLRDALRRRLTGRRAAEQLLEADETDPGVWERRIGAELADSGADRDERILTAAGSFSIWWTRKAPGPADTRWICAGRGVRRSVTAPYVWTPPTGRPQAS